MLGVSLGFACWNRPHAGIVLVRQLVHAVAAIEYCVVATIELFCWARPDSRPSLVVARQNRRPKLRNANLHVYGLGILFTQLYGAFRHSAL